MPGLPPPRQSSTLPPAPVLEPGRGKTREGRIWVYVGDKDHPYTVFDYTATRSREGPAKFFGDYAGYIQADAYGGYDHLFKPKPDGKPSPTELACWAHARRYFVEAEHADVLRSCTAVAMIGNLYAVETEAKDGTAQDRRALRQGKSVPQLAKIHAWLNEQFAYLKDVLARIAETPLSQLDQFLPDRWKAARSTSAPT